ncbi:hypothetical protein PRIPAC_79101 [Pristionchus pacificus]|uniref:Uncharacterized protein n=1 Tax=Pristionchus pacificus TaxID=54126 RepID=A0A2A6C478_PRIPA|nr:hypothetical protein PRIPAC_79101 [Pristionchus pacificus]|eukprot:PDM72926.1 hypothetical protein PRIPAC_39360 [Pristionchus pacificus]
MTIAFAIGRAIGKGLFPITDEKMMAAAKKGEEKRRRKAEKKAKKNGVEEKSESLPDYLIFETSKDDTVSTKKN